METEEKHSITLTYLKTELGTMAACATDKGICLFNFADFRLLNLEFKQLTTALKAPIVQGEHVLFDRLREQLEQYFKGERREFDIPLELVGTEFQKQTWLELQQIPYGTTTTYARQAELLGKPSAVRAVANANGRNKIAILLPCHRVIGANGTLTGYAGGLERKKKLLELEQLHRDKR